MKKETRIMKINRDTLEKLRMQYPDESLNEILGWAIFELTFIEHQSKKLKIPLENIKEANIFISSVSGIIGAKIITLTEVYKNEIEDVNFEDAMKIFEEEI